MKWVESDYQGIRFAYDPASKKPYLGKYYVKKTAASGTTRHRPVHKSFKTERQRLLWAEEVDTERAKNGANSLSLDSALRKKWETAQAIIGRATDPIEVALEWRKMREKAKTPSRNEILVNEVVTKFKDAASLGPGAEKIHHNEKMFQRLSDRYGREAFSSFAESTRDIEGWIRKLPFKPRTKLNHYKQYKEIFAWATRHRLVPENPFERILPPEQTEFKEIGIMSVEDVIRLLTANYDDPYTCALLAINLFGGMRTSAVGRIERDDLDLEKRTIYTPAWKTKKKRGQLIEKQPETMWLWIERARDAAFAPPCPNPEDKAERNIWKKKADRRIHARKEKALVRAGLAASTVSNKKKKSDVAEVAFAPPHNWARHSFCTYHCAAYRDLNETANLLSHAETIETLETHYKGLATQEEGHRFFAITPDFIAERIPK